MNSITVAAALEPISDQTSTNQNHVSFGVVPTHAVTTVLGVKICLSVHLLLT